MKHKYRIIALIIVALIALFFFETGRTRKKEFSCAELKKDYEQYPLNFEKIEANTDRCFFGYRWMGSRYDRLEFTVDGIYVKIGQEKQRLNSHRRTKSEDDIVKRQISHHDTLIRIIYRSSKEEDSLVDIFADFTFSYQGYSIMGSIRGLYRMNKKDKVKDIPEEIFNQTQERILKFVDTYFV